MKNFNNYIVEKLHINKEVKNDVSNKRDNSDCASKGAIIEVDLNNKYVFMMYDDNSGTISCFGCDSPQDLANEWSLDLEEAKKLCSLKNGKSLVDYRTGAITTLIS